jgi:hypothetical protein
VGVLPRLLNAEPGASRRRNISAPGRLLLLALLLLLLLLLLGALLLLALLLLLLLLLLLRRRRRRRPQSPFSCPHSSCGSGPEGSRQSCVSVGAIHDTRPRCGDHRPSRWHG